MVEKNRNLLRFETEALSSGYSVLAGIDEAGRGPLAGPVVAAAVVFEVAEANDFGEDIKDSKKLSEKQREKLFEFIVKKAKGYGVGIISEEEIDKINILNATLKAMKDSVLALSFKPDFLLIDGNKTINDLDIKQRAIVDGDCLSMSISAASIIAKVTRDRIMKEYHNIYPNYNFAKHKGYGTKEHYDAIKKHGPCKIHRRTFNLGI